MPLTTLRPGAPIAATTLSGLLLAASLSLADATSNFRLLDRDGDERLERTELSAFPPLLQGFDAADRDADGTLTEAEYAALEQQLGGSVLPE